MLSKPQSVLLHCMHVLVPGYCDMVDLFCTVFPSHLPVPTPLTRTADAAPCRPTRACWRARRKAPRLRPVSATSFTPPLSATSTSPQSWSKRDLVSVLVLLVFLSRFHSLCFFLPLPISFCPPPPPPPPS